MSEQPVQWLPAVLALAAGLALGAYFAWRSRRRAAALAAPLPLELRDLVARRDALIAQLRELEDTAAKRTPEQLARERYALELEAASILREVDERAPSASRAARPREAAAPAPGSEEGPPGAAGPGWLAERPALRGFLWGTGAMAALGLLVFFVARSTRPREQGGSVTGNTPMEGRGATPAADSEEAQLLAHLEHRPDDLDARVELARVKLGRQDLMGVWNETKYVLERQPAHPRALAYQSLVRLAMGQPEIAEQMLKRALAGDPDLFEAHVHLGLVYVKTGRGAEAEKAMAEAARRFPDQKETLGRLLAEMRAAVPSAEPGLEGDPHAGIGPPPASGEADRRGPDQPTRGAGPRVAGVVEADPATAARIPPGALLFVTVRDAAAQGGPPVAVKRLPAGPFPMRFEVGAADSMMGQPLPPRMRLEARVDSDGDPLTRAPEDPSARAEGIALGATDVRLVLKRRK